jgi:hypothetical protein
MGYNIAISVCVLDVEAHEILGDEMYTLSDDAPLAEWRVAYELELACKAVIEQVRKKLAEKESGG